MCGISGYQGWNDDELIVRMTEKIRHRGPDDSGVFCSKKDKVSLAHTRLSIQDTSSAGHQPMISGGGNIVLIFNGEIYNFKELRENLITKGVKFNGHSDTEVILNLYLSEGDAFLSKLNGIFALAIWNGQSQELLLARDGFGVKPLYYCETEKGFLFSSEIKSLLEEPSVSREISPSAIATHLTYLWSPAPSTLLTDVKKHLPGYAMTIRDGQISKKWSFYKIPLVQPMRNLSVPDAKNLVRKSIKNAVERQMVSDVPVGTFLSGGLDSSAITAFAKEFTDGQKLQCFTIALDDADAKKEGMVADLPYAKRVAKHLGVELNVIRANADMADELVSMIYHLDEPQADPAPLNLLFISRLARKQGIKVLLSGAGGDDIFSGYRRHHALLMEKYWSWLPLDIRKTISNTASLLPNRPTFIRRIRKALRYAGFDGDQRIASYFNWLEPEIVDGLLSSELRAELLSDNPLEQALASIPENIPALNRMLFLEQKYFLADHNLNYTDKMSMAAGVEVRVPLLDLELVELASRLPVEYKQRGKEGKWIFKKAMEGILPQDVIYRPKTGFGVPLRAWLRGPLKTLLYDTLSESSIKRRGWFDSKAVMKLLKADNEGKVDASYSIFALLCIELWGKVFLDDYTK